MPQQTIYIRNDDMPKWKALKNKSEFLSNALNGQIFGKIIKDVWDPDSIPTIETIPAVPKELEPRFCKNGHPIPYPKDRCLGKGCKYS